MNRSTSRQDRTRAASQQPAGIDHQLPPGRKKIRDSRARKRKISSAHFEQYAEEGNRIIDEIANELGLEDHRRALRITRAVLHALRDRLPVVDAIQFAQGLPQMLKAVYFDQYSISHLPVKIRNKSSFLQFIRSKDRAAEVDLPAPEDAAHALQAVLFVLANNMDRNQLEHVKRMLPKDIHNLIDEYDSRVLLDLF